eukprot:30073-Pelagococcus_subviridis.AAC.1
MVRRPLAIRLPHQIFPLLDERGQLRRQSSRDGVERRRVLPRRLLRVNHSRIRALHGLLSRALVLVDPHDARARGVIVPLRVLERLSVDFESSPRDELDLRVAAVRRRAH